MLPILLTCAVFVFLSWYWGRPESPPSRKSKETLIEACPNDGTGFFAVYPTDDIVMHNTGSDDDCKV